ncbi:MAG TPA: hypothetical protein VLV29_05800 [Steroidobacteraceae bacterium]|nr:hypothetical protein [Steroidobacteraceae bacterium]
MRGPGRAQIVIVGGGFGGLFPAKAPARTPAPRLLTRTGAQGAR